MPAEQPNIEQWGLFELTLPGPSAGNPFTEVHLQGRFEGPGRAFTAEGFYDGDGTYRLRFMPDAQGDWCYTTASNVPGLDGISGGFTCVAPKRGQSRPGACAQHLPLRLRRRHARTIPSARPATPGPTSGEELEQQTLAHAGAGALQQAAHVRLPQGYTYNATSRRSTLRAAQSAHTTSTASTPPSFAISRPRRRPPSPGHRGRRHPLPPLRPLGLRRTCPRADDALPALRRGAPGRLSATSGGRSPTSSTS